VTGKGLSVPAIVYFKNVVQDRTREFGALPVSLKQAAECLIFNSRIIEDELGERLKDRCARMKHGRVVLLMVCIIHSWKRGG
jgi:hypothetical protein